MEEGGIRRGGTVLGGSKVVGAGAVLFQHRRVYTRTQDPAHCRRRTGRRHQMLDGSTTSKPVRRQLRDFRPKRFETALASHLPQNQAMVIVPPPHALVCDM